MQMLEGDGRYFTCCFHQAINSMSLLVTASVAHISLALSSRNLMVVIGAPFCRHAMLSP